MLTSRTPYWFTIASILFWSSTTLLHAAMPPATAPALPLPNTPYRADLTLATPSLTAQGKVFYDHDKERREITLNNVKQILIIRRDKHLMWLLLPAEHKVMELPLGDNQSNLLTSGIAARDSTTLEQLPATHPQALALKGIKSTAYAFHSQPRAEANHPVPPLPTTGTLWLNADNIVVKLESRAAMAGGHMVPIAYALQNVQKGAQSADLFEIPPGYTRLEVPKTK